MKQFVLHPRSTHCVAPRSDTLLGLIAWGVRVVFGRDSVARFLGDPPSITSAFPWMDDGARRVHFFPEPVSGRADASTPRFLHEDRFVAFVTGQDAGDRGSVSPDVRRGHGGYFFFADGNNEHYVEPALRWLERTGFGGNAARGDHAFSVEVHVPEFLRRARAGEIGVLLSLALPSASDRDALASAVLRSDPRVAYALERRQGYASARPLSALNAQKRAVIALREGSIVPLSTTDAYGSMPTVAALEDDVGPFDVRYLGRGFVVPLLATGGAA